MSAAFLRTFFKKRMLRGLESRFYKTNGEDTTWKIMWNWNPGLTGGTVHMPGHMAPVLLQAGWHPSIQPSIHCSFSSSVSFVPKSFASREGESGKSLNSDANAGCRVNFTLTSLRRTWQTDCGTQEQSSRAPHPRQLNPWAA